MKMWKAVTRFLGPSHFEQIDIAITRAAHLCGLCESLRVTRDFYIDALRDIDPHQDWWRFADLKEKSANANRDYLMALEMADTAQNQAVQLCKL